MANQILFSYRHPSLTSIAMHHKDVQEALLQYFKGYSSNLARFASYTKREMEDELHKRLSEEDTLAVLSILASLEAAFRIDLIQRRKYPKNDPLSNALLTLHQDPLKIPLHAIFGVWEKFDPTKFSTLIASLKSAFKYRNWLAHGRYWQPDDMQRYGYDEVYELANNVLRIFPLQRI